MSKNTILWGIVLIAVTCCAAVFIRVYQQNNPQEQLVYADVDTMQTATGTEQSQLDTQEDVVNDYNKQTTHTVFAILKMLVIAGGIGAVQYVAITANHNMPKAKTRDEVQLETAKNIIDYLKQKNIEVNEQIELSINIQVIDLYNKGYELEHSDYKYFLDMFKGDIQNKQALELSAEIESELNNVKESEHTETTGGTEREAEKAEDAADVNKIVDDILNKSNDQSQKDHTDQDIDSILKDLKDGLKSGKISEDRLQEMLKDLRGESE